jgi:adenylyltransferase/sulfurtransferase
LAGRVQLTVIDSDRVAVSNLQRQILYRSSDLGRPKVECAAEHVRTRHPKAEIEPIVCDLDVANARGLIAQHRVVVDGTDSFASKFLLNDLCLELGVPLVHGAVAGWTGQLMTIGGAGACYRCIFEAAPAAPNGATCQEAGVLGALCGVIGGWMAQEVMAVLAQKPHLAGTLRVFDGRTERTRDVTPRRRASCPAHPASEVATW